MGFHGSAFGEPDAYPMHADESVEQKVQAGVGQRGVAYGGTYALPVLAQHVGDAELLVGSVAPVPLPHLLVQALGSGLGQPVSQQLHHHLLVGVVREVGFKSRIHRGGKHAHMVVGRTDEIGQTQEVAPWLLLSQTRYPGIANDDVVVLAMGIEQQENGVGAVCTGVSVEPFLGLLLQLRPVLLGHLVRAPGMEEVNPVDVGCHVGNGVMEYHTAWRLN